MTNTVMTKDDFDILIHYTCIENRITYSHILDIVNMHNELLDALRSIELSVDAVNGGGDVEKALSHIKEKAKKAIKKAKGE